ncbi:hypothetical protein H696_01889 [Fonticula alba]|uniref:EGF-like domain-containing protein n=1 Tax=Fonticula alba TaxID=691883 RepID=A0A058ZAE1_FONAL|nr:hypothetical protein H696_01889 [Fonticula alba]KCV70943.1 hypothetical protein H696_01889 [Fonticula alba]|eukprot:XP_009494066.1 hypothetical protein H696_01889 [Fonticula alba]
MPVNAYCQPRSMPAQTIAVGRSATFAMCNDTTSRCMFSSPEYVEEHNPTDKCLGRGDDPYPAPSNNINCVVTVDTVDPSSESSDPATWSINTNDLVELILTPPSRFIGKQTVTCRVTQNTADPYPNPGPGEQIGESTTSITVTPFICNETTCVHGTCHHIDGCKCNAGWKGIACDINPASTLVATTSLVVALVASLFGLAASL